MHGGKQGGQLSDRSQMQGRGDKHLIVSSSHHFISMKGFCLVFLFPFSPLHVWQSCDSPSGASSFIIHAINMRPFLGTSPGKFTTYWTGTNPWMNHCACPHALKIPTESKSQQESSMQVLQTGCSHLKTRGFPGQIVTSYDKCYRGIKTYCGNLENL